MTLNLGSIGKYLEITSSVVFQIWRISEAMPLHLRWNCLWHYNIWYHRFYIQLRHNCDWKICTVRVFRQVTKIIAKLTCIKFPKTDGKFIIPNNVSPALAANFLNSSEHWIVHRIFLIQSSNCMRCWSENSTVGQQLQLKIICCWHGSAHDMY